MITFFKGPFTSFLGLYIWLTFNLIQNFIPLTKIFWIRSSVQNRVFFYNPSPLKFAGYASGAAPLPPPDRRLWVCAG